MDSRLLPCPLEGGWYVVGRTVFLQGSMRLHSHECFWTWFSSVVTEVPGCVSCPSECWDRGSSSASECSSLLLSPLESSSRWLTCLHPATHVRDLSWVLGSCFQYHHSEGWALGNSVQWAALNRACLPRCWACPCLSEAGLFVSLCVAICDGQAQA